MKFANKQLTQTLETYDASANHSNMWLTSEYRRKGGKKLPNRVLKVSVIVVTKEVDEQMVDHSFWENELQ
jgi:hypothetical protein